LIHVGEPGMSIFQIYNAPGECTIHNKIYAPADRHCKSILLVFHRPVAALGIVRECPTSVVPGI
jgi:hypothetical protein